MNALAWPDIAVAFLIVVGALLGFKRGFIRELTGAFALTFALAAAFRYPGMWDGALAERAHVTPGATHVVGMLLYAALAYLVVLALGSVLSIVTKLPFVGLGNAVLGALVGVAKAVVFAWLVVYVGLFFPLSNDLRNDLHRSTLVELLQMPNARVDASVRASLPPFVAPFADGMFAAHRV